MQNSAPETENTVGEAFVCWLQNQVQNAGTGHRETRLSVRPDGRYWLGRLAPEQSVVNNPLGDRAERLEPCALGFRLKPKPTAAYCINFDISFHVWIPAEQSWEKSKEIRASFSTNLSLERSEAVVGASEITNAIRSTIGDLGFTAEVRIIHERRREGSELAILLVNTTILGLPETPADPRLYEVVLRIKNLETEPFLLEALPDSFRYDRRQFALGINCGVLSYPNNEFVSTDVVQASKTRPLFVPPDVSSIDISFERLAKDSVTAVSELVHIFEAWGDNAWSQSTILKRAREEHWSEAMILEATEARDAFEKEVARLRSGLDLLSSDSSIRTSFELMNKSFIKSSRGRYSSWRPFQLGFIVSALPSLTRSSQEAGIVDIVWFSTGGGKTETYLGILVTAAFYDRLRGKTSGITAWSRFPLRMLSLQQTQRFANALAAADELKREGNIPGDPFSLGFFVGDGSTPNSIKLESQGSSGWNCEDASMPSRVRVLDRCPYCNNTELKMAFNRRLWKLEHRCEKVGCTAPEQALPIYVVDDEIYRFLPTVIVGTLDKAAAIGMQAAMRGFVGAPSGMCSVLGHGYTYSIRKSRSQHGCLIERCKGTRCALPIKPELFPPTYRLQDELHLLKDSLGAVDAHYESLFDDLQHAISGVTPKILASSATLTGYEKQVDVLYRRKARVFPQPGPSATQGFWTRDSSNLMRRFIAVAPRGVTLEYAVDRTLTALQDAIRRLKESPALVCSEIGISEKWADFLINVYGTDVVYGNNLKDLDAVVRSAATQIQVDGKVNTQSLTGRSSFEEVRETLKRLDHPESSFDDRIHLIAASSMMSHGVDIDRLNVMVMLGLPLTTAEFIQASARVGRKFPALVVVMHKIGRERDASIFRSFEKFIEQGERFVEAIPVTRRSRRVLERTLPGILFARILAIHEYAQNAPLTTIQSLKAFYDRNPQALAQDEVSIMNLLVENSAQDQPIRAAISEWFTRFSRNLEDPPVGAEFPSDLSPTTKPMRSLRDVEEQVKIFGSSGD